MQNPWSNYCNGLKNDPVEIFSTYYIYLPTPVNENFVTFISLAVSLLSFYSNQWEYKILIIWMKYLNRKRVDSRSWVNSA